ncbi:MAG: glycosyl transferase group 1 [Thermoleophilia bacterium]|nr:glycosyl transferase group 1 [Thermoleophilia bacterium]
MWDTHASVNVLYLHQHFATRKGGGGTRSWEFARHLHGRGHQVTMVAQRRRAGGISEPGRYDLDGVKVILLGGYYTNHLKMWRRMMTFLRYTIHASFLRNFPNRPDVVIASSTPLSIGIPGWILARRFGVPFVFEVRDLWPEAPIQLGVVKSPLLKRAAVWLERFLYRNADVVIPLSPGMEAGVLAAGCAPEKVVTIPNASDIDLFAPEHRDRALLEPWGFEDKFVAVHAGMMGEANGLDYVAKAAEVLRDRGEDDIAILVVGEGITKARLERFAAERGLTNIIFTGMIPREQLGAIVSSCDTCLVSFADFPVLQTNSPNKLFDGFAAGLPAVVNSAGWTKRLVEANDAGAYVDVTKPEELADALVTLRDDPELRARQAANAHRLGTEVFARERLSTRFADVLEFAATIRNGQPTMPAELRAPLIPESAQEPTAPA